MKSFIISFFYTFSKMYWSEPGRIRRSNLDGSSIEDFVTSDASRVTGIVIQYSTFPSDIGSRLIWLDAATSDVMSIDLSGSGMRDVIVHSSISQASHIAVVEVNL